MPASRWSSTSHTADVSATSSIWRASSDSPPSTTSSTKMPSVKPATPPGDGDTGIDSHWAPNTIGTSISATADARPLGRARPAAHRHEQQQRGTRVAAEDREQHAPVLFPGAVRPVQAQREGRRDAGQAHLGEHPRGTRALRVQRARHQRRGLRLGDGHGAILLRNDARQAIQQWPVSVWVVPARFG